MALGYACGIRLRSCEQPWARLCCAYGAPAALSDDTRRPSDAGLCPATPHSRPKFIQCPLSKEHAVHAEHQAFKRHLLIRIAHNRAINILNIAGHALEVFHPRAIKPAHHAVSV